MIPAAAKGEDTTPTGGRAKRPVAWAFGCVTAVRSCNTTDYSPARAMSHLASPSSPAATVLIACESQGTAHRVTKASLL